MADTAVSNVTASTPTNKTDIQEIETPVVIVEEPTTSTTSENVVVPSTTNETSETLNSSNTLQVAKDPNGDVPRNSFDDIIGKFDTFRQKLRDGTLDIEDKDAFKELHDAVNKEGEHGQEGDEHNDTANGRRQGRHGDGQQQRWSIRKSIRSFWRGDRSVGDEAAVCPPVDEVDDENPRAVSSLDSVPPADLECSVSEDLASPTNDVPDELATPTSPLPGNKLSLENANSKDGKDDKRRSKGWKSWMFWQAETGVVCLADHLLS
ncbi:hypothetical protein BDF22DRAFT_654055 [Syncephalis plumigaleata]|nr:hypothetical protein BDF22DRAFT_654055 [Syncephalis plumigaleata]